MLFIGDQVYADETGPAIREFIEGRRDPAVPPGYEVAGAYTSYWVYQHLGNLAPAEPVLREMAVRADARGEGPRWSVRRDVGPVRVVVIDSRSRRVVDDDRDRLMVDEGGRLRPAGERLRQSVDLEHRAACGRRRSR